MELKFEVRDPATFFHFLDSISLWSIHTRKSVKKYYEGKFGISKEDKEIIKRYVSIRKKYPWEKLDSDFYISKDFEDVHFRLNKRLKKKEYGELNLIIEHFRPNIKKIFTEWKPHLIFRKKQLEKETSKHNLKKLFSEIVHFYESKNYPEIVTIHLVVNTWEHSSGGGANIIPKEHITIEPLRLKDKNKSLSLHAVSVIAHEVLHLIEYKSNKNKLKNFKDLSRKKKLNLGILREAIADTLVPDGYLALKYKLVDEIKILRYNKFRSISKYKENNESKHYRKFRQKLSSMLYPITKKQFEEGKSMFEGDYIKNCIDKYLEMIRKN